MHTKSNLYPLIFLLISIRLLGFFCQEDHLNYYSNCGHAFQCAKLSNLTYPFWDIAKAPPRRTSFLCGHPSFGLDCSGTAPILNISGVPYRIIDFPSSKYVMKVTRQDLYMVNPCNPVLLNTTLNSGLFEFLPNFRYQNVTLYYNCTEKVPGLPNQFKCGDLRTTTNFFQTQDHDPNEYTCEQQITFPMSEPMAGGMKTEDDLFQAAQTGDLGSFAIKWSADNMLCEACLRLGHTCAYSNPPLTTPNSSLIWSSDFFCYISSSSSRKVALTPPPILGRDEPGERPNPPGFTFFGSLPLKLNRGDYLKFLL